MYKIVKVQKNLANIVYTFVKSWYTIYNDR